MNMSNSCLDRCPAFFKVYLPQFCSHHLQIPPAFESHVKGASTTICCRGMKWNVNIQRDKDGEDEEGLFFKKGWSKFVKDNALEVGEFLVFYYDKGNSSFTVKLFSRSCCERKSKFKATKVDVKREAPSDEAEEDIQNNNVNVKINSKRKAPGSNDALEKANRYKPEHPFFRALLYKTYVTRRSPFMHIPSNFWKSYIEGRSRAELECSGKSWKVGMQYQGAGRIITGWPEFVKDNELKVGDVCVFERPSRYQAWKLFLKTLDARAALLRRRQDDNVFKHEPSRVCLVALLRE